MTPILKVLAKDPLSPSIWAHAYKAETRLILALGHWLRRRTLNKICCFCIQSLRGQNFGMWMAGLPIIWSVWFLPLMDADKEKTLNERTKDDKGVLRSGLRRFQSGILIYVLYLFSKLGHNHVKCKRIFLKWYSPSVMPIVVQITCIISASF